MEPHLLWNGTHRGPSLPLQEKAANRTCAVVGAEQRDRRCDGVGPMACVRLASPPQPSDNEPMTGTNHMRDAAIKIIRLFVFLASLGMMAACGEVGLIALTGSADISDSEMVSLLVVGIAPLPWLALFMTKAIWSQKRIPSAAILFATIFSITLAIHSLIRLGYDESGLSGNAQRLHIVLQSILICLLLWGLYRAALIVKRVVPTKTSIRAGKQTDSGSSGDTEFRGHP